jgi:hypothetical protein
MDGKVGTIWAAFKGSGDTICSAFGPGWFGTTRPGGPATALDVDDASITGIEGAYSWMNTFRP